ncbi:MAG: aspartate 1-decarboxylase [Planctomycetota bacterium]
MLRTFFRSKIHRATVTSTHLEYDGSITIDRSLLEAADMLPGERVQVVNLSNGSRLETYIIEGDLGSGTICLNGPAARCAVPGDKVIVIAYAQYGESELDDYAPKVVLVNDKNELVEVR